MKVFGPEARPLISQLTTEGQHRGAVIAALQDRKRDTPEPAAAAQKAADSHSHEASHAWTSTLGLYLTHCAMSLSETMLLNMLSIVAHCNFWEAFGGITFGTL